MNRRSPNLAVLIVVASTFVTAAPALLAAPPAGQQAGAPGSANAAPSGVPAPSPTAAATQVAQFTAAVAPFDDCAKLWATATSDPKTPVSAADLSAVTTALNEVLDDQKALAAAKKANDDASQAETTRCQENLVLCIDEDGTLNGADILPTLVPADVLQVDVVGYPSEVATSRVHLHFSVKTMNSSIVQSSPYAGSANDRDGDGIADNVDELMAHRIPVASPSAGAASVVTCLGTRDRAITTQLSTETLRGPLVALGTATSAPIVASDTNVKVVFQRDAATSDSKDSKKTAATATFNVDVDPGRYYVDLGVMIPFTVDRSIQSVADLSTGQNRVGVKWNARIVPAFVINMYLAGRARGRISSWEGPSVSENLWGIQVGTGLEFGAHPFGEFYGGALFTPITGVSFSAGVAVVNEQVLRSGETAGMYLPAGVTYSPDTRYMPWPYVGFSATLDFVDLLRTGFARATSGGGGSTAGTPKSN